jgi:Clp amino terminal domain, pathogenicity island component
MFERFTERARRVLFFAHDEASQLGSIRIDTEHLLLGLIRDGKGLTNRLFADAGIALDDIRDEVLRRVPARSKTSTSADIPFSAATNRVLQHSAEEADRLLHDYLGTEHLLLGLLSEEGSVAADVLTSRGLRLDRVREHIVKLLSDGMRPGHPGPPSIPANTFKWPWLRFVASRSVHILYSELKPPQQPVTNYSGPGLQAYGYTLTEAIVHAWRGNRWHIDIIDVLDDGTRYDFYIQFAQTEPGETFQQMWRDAIERQFELYVGQVIDETDLRGLYGFELTRTVDNRDELIQLLRNQAGVSITREQHDTPTLVVRRR